MFQNLEPKYNGSVAGGFFLGFVPGLIINLVSGFLSVAGSQARFLPFMFAGMAVGQVLFSVPFYFYFKSQGKDSTCRGLIIGASVACLVGVTCGVRLGV